VVFFRERFPRNTIPDPLNVTPERRVSSRRLENVICSFLQILSPPSAFPESPYVEEAFKAAPGVLNVLVLSARESPISPFFCIAPFSAVFGRDRSRPSSLASPFPISLSRGIIYSLSENFFYECPFYTNEGAGIFSIGDLFRGPLMTHPRTGGPPQGTPASAPSPEGAFTLISNEFHSPLILLAELVALTANFFLRASFFVRSGERVYPDSCIIPKRKKEAQAETPSSSSPKAHFRLLLIPVCKNWYCRLIGKFC